MTLISRYAIFSHETGHLHSHKPRQWAKLSPDVRGRIDRRLTEFATTGHGDVKRLKGRDESRLRVGDWRVIFYEDQGTTVVATVGHRREIHD